MKILIVEDEPSLREIMYRALVQEHYVVETAATYADADAKVAGYSYDCILLDIMLPDGNGLRLLEHIKELRKRENVIIISARNSLEDKVLGLEQGADDYLPKPFHTAELLARIRSVLRRGRSGGDLSLSLGNVSLWPEGRRVEVEGRELALLKRSSTSCSTSCSARTIWSTRPCWPKPSGATMPTTRTTSISSMPR